MSQKTDATLRQRFTPCPPAKPAATAAHFLCLAIGLMVLFSASPLLRAQRFIVAPGYRFSPQGQAVVMRLASFNSLPGRDWQLHEGPLAPGEDAATSTEGWKDVRIPFVSSSGEVWIRRLVEIPKTLNGYDLTGANVSFYLMVGADGPGHGYAYETIYYNGKKVVEGTHIYKIPLFTNAHPGDKIMITVNMPPTGVPKRFDTARFQVTFAADRPDPSVLQVELASTAELLPWITHDPAELKSQEQTLEAAATTVNLAALDAGDQKAFDASVKEAEAKLVPLRPVMKKGVVTMTANAHIDAIWLWTESETVDQVHFTFDNALQLMREYPQFVFAQSAAQYYEWMKQKFPVQFAEIQKRVKEGQWELVGGMWIEPDLNMPDGEADVRELLVGKEFFQQNFGVDVKVGWNPDSFGFNWQLPQIYKKSGIDYFLTQKLNYNDDNILPLKLFWWESPDGSKVLTFFPHDYVQDIQPIRIAGDLAAVMKADPGDNTEMHLYGPSLGRLGIPWGRDVVQTGIQWTDPDKIYPQARFSTAKAFFDDMARRADTADAPVWNYKTFAAGETQIKAPDDGKIHLPIWDDELYLEHHRGTYTTQAKQKADMRHSEEELLDAEKLASLGWLGGLDYPQSRLTEAWKRDLLDDFHDMAAGTGIAQIYRDGEKDYDMIRWVTGDASRNALNDVDSHIDTAAQAGVPIIVWNTLSWARTEAVPVSVQMPGPEPNGIAIVDASGKPVLMQVLAQDNDTHTYKLLVRAQDVPSVGYTVLYAVPGARKVPTDLAVHGTTLENAQLRVVLDPATGCITSLYQKKTGVETLAPGACGNELEAFKDSNLPEDAWNIERDYEKYRTNLTMLDSMKVLEHGPLRATIEITRSWSKSKFVQDIELEAGSPQVDVVNSIDWHETHVMLKAAFPLAASSPEATYEIPYGSIQRPTTRNNSIEDSKFEVPALRWADLGDGKNGFSLLNDSKYGYDARGNVLRLTLLRAPTYPDPTADRGHQEFTYALYPHAGTWQDALTVRRGYELNYKLRAVQVIAHTGVLPATHTFVSLTPDNLVLTAMKRSDDGGALILRFYEWAGRHTEARITVPSGATGAAETNLMEHTVDGANAMLPVTGNEVKLAVGPYSIDTVRVNYGARSEAFWQAQK
jgi:alpha-mannosidase